MTRKSHSIASITAIGLLGILTSTGASDETTKKAFNKPTTTKKVYIPTPLPSNTQYKELVKVRDEEDITGFNKAVRAYAITLPQEQRRAFRRNFEIPIRLPGQKEATIDGMTSLYSRPVDTSDPDSRFDFYKNNKRAWVIEEARDAVTDDPIR